VRIRAELGDVWVEDRRAIIAGSASSARRRGSPSALPRRQPANVEVISQGASAINMTFVAGEDGLIAAAAAEFFVVLRVAGQSSR
jgi:hypothetical protein